MSLDKLYILKNTKIEQAPVLGYSIFNVNRKQGEEDKLKKEQECRWEQYITNLQRLCVKVCI